MNAPSLRSALLIAATSLTSVHDVLTLGPLTQLDLYRRLVVFDRPLHAGIERRAIVVAAAVEVVSVMGARHAAGPIERSADRILNDRSDGPNRRSVQPHTCTRVLLHLSRQPFESLDVNHSGILPD